MEACQAWIRYHSFRQARKMNPKGQLTDVIEDAARIAAFVFKEPLGKVEKINKAGEN